MPTVVEGMMQKEGSRIIKGECDEKA